MGSARNALVVPTVPPIKALMFEIFISGDFCVSSSALVRQVVPRRRPRDRRSAGDGAMHRLVKIVL
jgi:hypothetical protein